MAGKSGTWWLAMGSFAVMSCGGGDSPQGDAAAELSGPSIFISSPADGAVVDGGSITVQLSTTGVDVVPAGMQQTNSGHHHLFLNRDPTPAGETIPAEEGIVHLGGGQTEYEFTGLQPGVYSITAVLGDHTHIRIAEIEPFKVMVTVN